MTERYLTDAGPWFQDYCLPDGRIVAVDATAAKGEPVIGFTLADGRIVDARLVNGTAYRPECAASWETPDTVCRYHVCELHAGHDGPHVCDDCGRRR